MNIIEYLKDEGYEDEAKFLEDRQKNSIRVTTEPAGNDDFDLGESKVGGTPHLPKSTTWPYFNEIPLTFVAQLNMKDVAKYDTENKLPQNGILYFFFEGGIDVWGYETKDKEGFKVIYYDGDLNDLKPMEQPETNEDYEDIALKPCKLKFISETSYPESQAIENDDIDIDIIDDYYEEEETVAVHKILGYPDLIQGDIFYEAAEMDMKINEVEFPEKEEYDTELKNELDKWIMLFQMDSDDNADIIWGDVGRVYFTIKENDLKNKDFENGWIHFQCY